MNGRFRRRPSRLMVSLVMSMSSLVIIASLIQGINCETSSFSLRPRSRTARKRSKVPTVRTKLSSSASSSASSSSSSAPSSNDDKLSTPYSNSQTSTSSKPTNIQKAIQSFENDIKYLESQPKTDLTTSCIILCRDTTYTKLWTIQDWKDHSKHALSRYSKHFFSWAGSTTMQNIIGAVILSCTWSLTISKLAQSYHTFKITLKNFTVTLAFLQAPILLLLTLRTNRALDRLLESRRAWGAMNRATRTMMGLVCGYILPKHPQAGCIIARYLAICGWVLKGSLRNEDDTELIRNIMHSVPQEAEWLLAQNKLTGVKTSHAIVCRMRNMLSILSQEDGSNNGDGIDIPPIILLRMEEMLHNMESTIGICNRVLTSPIPPTYTRHTSRVLVMYLGILPVALVGMGISALATVATVACASYILIGIDEIGLEIEQPFPIMPLFGLSTSIQKEVERQVQMLNDMPPMDI